MLNGPGQRSAKVRESEFLPSTGKSRPPRVPSPGAPSFRHERRWEGHGGPLTNRSTFSTPKTYYASHQRRLVVAGIGCKIRVANPDRYTTGPVYGPLFSRGLTRYGVTKVESTT